MSDVPDNNPKSRFGIVKPNPFFIPPAAEIYMALAMGEGARKYGPYNWRLNKVTASVYVAAARRHLAQWVDGQNNDDNPNGSGLPHIGHAMACLAILADAIETGNLIDDRPPHGSVSVLIDKWTKTLPPPPIEPPKTTTDLNSRTRRRK